MKKIRYMLIFEVILCLALSKQIYSIDCICDPYLISINIDTLQPGIVEVKRCYAPCENESCCVVDTISEKALLDSLIEDYNRNKFVIIAYIDSLINVPAPDSPIVEPYPLTESLHIVVDSTFKEPFVERNIWIMYSGFCKWSAQPMLNKKFIAFFDTSYQFIEDLGLYPRNECEGEVGYFIEEGRIKKSGNIHGLPGVSVELSKFFDAIGVNIINRKRSYINPKKKVIEISLNSKRILLKKKGIISVNIFNMSGKRMQVDTFISIDRVIMNIEGLKTGIYLLKVGMKNNSYVKNFIIK